VRVDAGVYAGVEVPVFYDPMIAKLATWGRDRNEALCRMRRALGECTIAGELTTNLDFHRWLLNHPRFLAGDFDTGFIAQEYRPDPPTADHDAARSAAILAAAVMAIRDNDGSAAVQPAGRGAVSAWKMLGRADMLRR
jgi:acetyl/propionyl-CoA carboxylase alpha subunit